MVNYTFGNDLFEGLSVLVPPVHLLTRHTGYVVSCAFASDGGTLVTVSHNDTTRVYIAIY